MSTGNRLGRADEVSRRGAPCTLLKRPFRGQLPSPVASWSFNLLGPNAPACETFEETRPCRCGQCASCPQWVEPIMIVGGKRLGSCRQEEGQ